MTVDKALEQARAAIEIRSKFPTTTVTILAHALRALVAAVEEREPHVIDTRRIAALEMVKPSPVSLTVAHLRRPGWWVSLGETSIGAGHSAAEALASAEREARP